MGIETGIAWADHTFSPWEGCVAVHTGCKNCYARANNRRWNGGRHWGAAGPRRVMAEASWNRVLGWDRAALKEGMYRRIFPSICDPFEDYGGPVVNAKGEVQDKTLWGLRRRLFKLMDDTPGLFWILLTKRPEHVYGMVPKHWLESPPSNVMIVASASDQATTEEMVAGLVEWPGHKGLSLEPLVGPVAFDGIKEIDWIVIGGESGAGARDCDIWWIHMLISECSAVGVPCYVKQLGARPYRDMDDCRMIWPVGTEHVEDIEQWRWCPELKHDKGGDPGEWPAVLRVREYPAFMEGAPPLVSG